MGDGALAPHGVDRRVARPPVLHAHLLEPVVERGHGVVLGVCVGVGPFCIYDVSGAAGVIDQSKEIRLNRGEHRTNWPTQHGRPGRLKKISKPSGAPTVRPAESGPWNRFRPGPAKFDGFDRCAGQVSKRRIRLFQAAAGTLARSSSASLYILLVGYGGGWPGYVSLNNGPRTHRGTGRTLGTRSRSGFISRRGVSWRPLLT